MLHRRIAIPVAVAAIAVATIFAFLPVSAAVSVGSKAPSFKVVDLDGKSIGLSDLMGKPSIIVFWATWCPHCRAELPVMERVWKDLNPKGISMVAISLDSDSAAARKFVRDNHITIPVAIAGSGSPLMGSYGITGIPSVFVLDKDGVVKARWAGEVGESTVRSELAKLGVK